jgi:hypothetical protein
MQCLVSLNNTYGIAPVQSSTCEESALKILALLRYATVVVTQ